MNVLNLNPFTEQFEQDFKNIFSRMTASTKAIFLSKRTEMKNPTQHSGLVPSSQLIFKKAVMIWACAAGF